MSQLQDLMRQNFVDYASYSILDRAIPDLRDGLKPVQRRILHTLFEMHDGRYHKVANVVGETMKLHPHGDAAIGDALVVLANKDYFIDKQGNFGSILTGHPAAAPRYIECRLTPLALETIFNEDLTEFRPSYDGRNREPIVLPAKIPIALMLGSEGIAVGMATRILPHNLVELWEAQISILHGEEIELEPDFPQGGIADISEYDDGRGKVEIRARLRAPDPKRIVDHRTRLFDDHGELDCLDRGRGPEGSRQGRDDSRLHDGSGRNRTRAVARRDSRGSHPAALRLYGLQCIRDFEHRSDSRPTPCAAIGDRVLRELTENLREQIRAELEWEQKQLLERKHWLTLEALFVEHKIYRRIETAETDRAVRKEVKDGMREYADQLVRPLVDDDITNLLALRIRRISAYDKAKNRGEIEAIDGKLARSQRSSNI